MKTNRAIYALYSNNTFVSWLYGAFCQLTTIPKFYSYDGVGEDFQSPIVINNLKYKLSSRNEKSTFGQSLALPIDNIIDNGQNKDNGVLKDLSNFTLGVFFVKEEECDEDFLSALSKQVPNDTFEIL